jgi:hypothetical protein
LSGTQTSGYYLRSDGTNTALAAIVAGDVPTLNQNTTGTAANVTGTVAIANGGTGQTTANAAFNALAPSQTGNSGKYLTTDGTDTSWASNPLGTVTSVGGTGTVSGISLSGTVTTSGNLTLGGALDLSAYNGAGAFTSLSASGLFSVNTARAKPTITSSTGTNDVTINLTNTGGALVLGRENSTSTEFGLPAYSSALYSGGVYNLYLGANGVVNVVKVLSTGIAVTGALSSTGMISTTVTNQIFDATGTSTSPKYGQIGNGAGLLTFGVEGSAGGALITGTSAYDTAFTGGSGRGIAFGQTSSTLWARLSVSGLTVNGSIYGNGGNSLGVGNSDNTNYSYFINSGATGANNANLTFNMTNKGELMRLTSDGNFGVGTNNPSVRLQAEASSSTSLTTLYLVNSSSAAVTTKQSSLSFRLTDTAGTRKNGFQLTAYADSAGGNIENGGLIFSGRKADNDTEFARITSTGNFDIGSSASGQPVNGKLTIYQSGLSLGASNSIVIGNNDTGGAGSQAIWLGAFGNGAYGAKVKVNYNYAATVSTSLSFETSNGGTLTEAVRIDASQNVGIGTNNPIAKLDVENTSAKPFGTAAQLNAVFKGSVSIGEGGSIGFDYFGSHTNCPTSIGYAIESQAGSTNGSLVFGTRSVTTDTAPTERMRIDSVGRITMPYQSGFAYGSCDVQVVGSNYILFSSGSYNYNVGSILNLTGGTSGASRVTVPVSGYYSVNVSIMGSTDGSRIEMFVAKNGVNIFGTNAISSQYNNAQINGIFYFAANDYIEIFKQAGTIHSSNSPNNFFTVRLLG